MKLDNLTKGRVLIVGDGDFTYTLALSRMNLNTNLEIVSSCYEASLEELVARYPDVEDSLERIPFEVRFGVDATQLDASEQWDVVIFNYPQFPPLLKARNKIQCHRSLLKGFFASVHRVLTDCGEVIVTLCKGQGGTKFDESAQRVYNDSWKVLEMAAYGSMLLKSAEPADSELKRLQEFGYVPTGNRGVGKGFNTDFSVIHVFVKDSTGVVAPDCLVWDRDLSIEVVTEVNLSDVTAGVTIEQGLENEIVTEVLNRFHCEGSIALFDRFVKTDKVNRGYRLKFHSSTRALTREAANDITETLRLELERVANQR